jgi:DNA-binding transcriptional LysR family regulator
VAPTTNQVRRQILLRDDYVCLVPPDHGARGRALTLAELVDLPHVVVGLGRPGPTLLDDALAEKGHERRVVARVSDFGAAGVVASALRLLWTVPRRLGERVVERRRPPRPPAPPRPRFARSVMNPIRLLPSVVAAVFSCAALAACSSEASDDGPAPAPDAATEAGQGPDALCPPGRRGANEATPPTSSDSRTTRSSNTGTWSTT